MFFTKNKNKKKILALITIITYISSMLTFALFLNVAQAKGFDPGFNVSSKGIYLGNIKTEGAAYEKDSDKRLEPASTTKIMTCLLALENSQDIDNDIVKVSENAVKSLEGTDAATARLKVGEEMPLVAMLHCLMVPSGCDAALALAEHVSGDVDSFVKLMNNKAQELGCSNTHFENPHGLPGSDHYTTARDMYKIAEYAINIPHFMDICSQVSYLIPATNLQESRRIYTTNYMLLQLMPQYYYAYAKGIKTGRTDTAGYCLVSSATYDGDTYICVALGAPDKDEKGEDLPNGACLDSRSLYRWVFTSFNKVQVANAGDPVTEVPIQLCWDRDTIMLAPNTDTKVLLPKNKTKEDIKFVDVRVPKNLKAPIKRGDFIGYTSIECDGNIVQTDVELFSANDAERSNFLYIISILRGFFESGWFIIMLVVLLALFLLYWFKLSAINKNGRHMKSTKGQYREDNKF